ncbi:enhancer of mRNA-decapping protein 4-like [Rhinophrynus dorsalis]
MDLASSIDLDATQHLRDILKLDRPGDSVNDDQKKSNAVRSEMNGAVVPCSIDAEDSILPDPALRNVAMTLSDRQIICLTGNDNSSYIEITSKDVEIVASKDSSICSKARGSNKVRIQPVAKYDWEQKYYSGNLIAVSNSYLAYAIRGANGSAMVRVLSITTAERILLKGITGGVTDVTFTHLNSNQLACLDEAGSLFVWRITMENGKIQDDIVVHIQRPDTTPLNNFRRIIWCPYIPDENEENTSEESSQIVALLHEDKAEVWDLEIVRANHNKWPTDVTDIKEGFIVVRGHSGSLSEGALSPDGTVLATASHDGYVKFWQIYIEGQDQPRCLHEWKPHNGRPLSCLLFCDNHKKQDPDVPFWRFLVTGADQNRELKMWCTVSWTCLQTKGFSPEKWVMSPPSSWVGLPLLLKSEDPVEVSVSFVLPSWKDGVAAHNILLPSLLLGRRVCPLSKRRGGSQYPRLCHRSCSINRSSLALCARQAGCASTLISFGNPQHGVARRAQNRK